MQGVCKYFINSGSCCLGASCRFLHPDAAHDLAMKQRWVSEKVTRRCMRPTIPADSADPHGKVRAPRGRGRGWGMKELELSCNGCCRRARVPAPPS